VDEGFMFFQPPLYYALAAHVLGSDPLAPRSIQALGLLISIGTLAAGLWLLHLACGPRGDPPGLLLAQGALAVFPSFALLAPRLNNDVLAVFWSFLALAFLVRWWREGARRDLLVTSVCIGLGLLSKGTTLLLIPVLAGCLLLRPASPWREKLRLGALAAVIVVLLAGWQAALRIGAQDQGDLAGNLGVLSPALEVPTHPSTLAIFNPLRIVRSPFVNEWMSGRDRDMFLEYLFRSSLFGEFNFSFVPPWLVRGLVLATLATLLASLGGFLVCLLRSWRDSLPLGLTLLVLFLGHLVYRQMAPVSSSQDFRYSLPLLLPLLGFAACLGVRLPGAWRWLPRLALGALALAATAFLALVVASRLS
jgi:4-amino-4-deoxy-L-arabinose transferase-like glycosyltransferase